MFVILPTQKEENIEHSPSCPRENIILSLLTILNMSDFIETQKKITPSL